MIWIVLLIVGILMIIIDDCRSNWFAMGIILAIIGGLISLFVICFGVSTYPDLLAKRAEVYYLEKSIVAVREAYYKTESCENAIVSGSLDNLSQGSKLAEYIIEVSKSKAKYNSDLVMARKIRELISCAIFGEGMFISDKILELEELE